MTTPLFSVPGVLGAAAVALMAAVGQLAHSFISPGLGLVLALYFGFCVGQLAGIGYEMHRAQRDNRTPNPLTLSVLGFAVAGCALYTLALSFWWLYIPAVILSLPALKMGQHLTFSPGFFWGGRRPPN
jgi:hypothetical protein